MKAYVLFTLLLTPFALVFGQEHNSKALTIEELMQKNNPKAYQAKTSTTNFLVLANYRNGKRQHYFRGDLLRFKTKDNHFYEEEIAFIDDSTFNILLFNKESNMLEQHDFKLSDVKIIYKHPRGGFVKTAVYTMLGFIPMALIDWGVYKTPPHQNDNLLTIAPIVGLGSALLFKRKQLFNKQRLRGNKELKIVKPAGAY